MGVDRELLFSRYVIEKKSMQEIAHELNCSVNKISYWLVSFGIKRRTISEAVYQKYNPNGDPFLFCKPKNIEDGILFGLGLGLYWGEGAKSDISTIKLGNTDPHLIKKFIEFLEKLFGIKKSDLRFSLQIFSDINSSDALSYWVKRLKVRRGQFYKTTISKSVAKGTYRKKSRYGVLIVYYHNKKLRDLIVNLLPL